MANAKKVEAISEEVVETVEAPATVTIPVATANYLYDLYRNIESADAHFHRCQSDNFRQHVVSVYNAANVRNAFSLLKSAIDKEKGE